MSDEASVLEVASTSRANGSPPRREFSPPPAHERHVVQFYDDDDFLCDSVARYVIDGLTAGDPVLAIATPAHRQAIERRMRLAGCDVEAAIANEQLAFLDAAETLASFMVGDEVDPQRFQAAVWPTVEKVLAGRPARRLRAFGEMVDLLWRDGRRQAAIGLEHHWNKLAAQHHFSLLCAYVMGNFYRSPDGEPFEQVCATHHHVFPPDVAADLEGGTDHLRTLSLLEQKTRSLENEVNERKEIERALREALARESAAREHAEHSSRFNEMFAAILGHDLRNPLGAIVMGASYISRVDSGDLAVRAANRILSSAERMARMIDQLLDVSRIRIGGGITLSVSRFDLAHLCYRIKDELEAAHPDCSITIETHGNTVGVWDYDRMLQVFSNLIGNAIKHGVTGCLVSVRTDGSEASRVMAEVHNGGEIAPEILPVIFEPFRGSRRVDRTRGLGLGLYITRQIVLAHGGAIEATSEPSDGTTMHVDLPREPRRPGLTLARRFE